MDLQNFFPYRLAVLAETVSRAIAQVYADRFDLNRDEWRVLAQLGEHAEAPTSEIVVLTTLDKMQVSRAVARLEKAALIEREESSADRRQRILRITPAGRALYRKILPMAQAREAFLLEALGEDERQVLQRAMDKLLERAEQLERQG